MYKVKKIILFIMMLIGITGCSCKEETVKISVCGLRFLRLLEAASEDTQVVGSWNATVRRCGKQRPGTSQSAFCAEQP